jgi:hypothetical protein
MSVSTCATPPKRMGRSSYQKQMTSVTVISAQHPKNARAIIQTIEKKLNPFEEAGRTI